jgi:hypothetical protein
MTNFKVDQLFIKDIRIIKGELDSPFHAHISDIIDFESDMDFAVSVNTDNSEVLAEFTVTIKAIFEANTAIEAHAHFELGFLFGIGNFNKMVTQLPDETFELDNSLMNAVASITYSTSRGILLTRFQGTLFRDFLLPIIHPNSLFD